MRIWDNPFAICVFHFSPLAKCSIKTCSYTIKLLVNVSEVCLLRIYSHVWRLEADQVGWGVIPEHLLKAFFFFFDIVHIFIWFRIFEWLLNLLDLLADFLFDTVEIHPFSSDWGLSVVGWVPLSERQKRSCAQGRLSFPQGRETCKVPARLDLLPLLSFYQFGFLKGC